MMQAAVHSAVRVSPAKVAWKAVTAETGGTKVVNAGVRTYMLNVLTDTRDRVSYHVDCVKGHMRRAGDDAD